MKKSIFVLFLCCVLFGSCECTPSVGEDNPFLPPWSKVFGEEKDEYSKVLAHDSEGNVLVAGLFLDKLDFEIVQFQIPRDIFILKYDKTGKELWKKIFSSSGGKIVHSMVVDSSNNLILVGSFDGELKFEEETFQSKGYNDIFAFKIAPTGKKIWAKTWGSEQNDEALSVAVQGEKISIAGYFSRTMVVGETTLQSKGSRDPFVFQVDSKEGKVLWATSFGSESFYEKGTHVAMDSVGNTVLMGQFYDSMQTSLGDLPSIGYEDIFVMKLDSNGKILWQKALGSKKKDTPNSLGMDSQGSIYLAFQFIETIQVMNQALYSSGIEDILLLELSSTGQEKSYKQISFQTKKDYESFVSTYSGSSFYLASESTSQIKINGKDWKHDQKGDWVVLSIPLNGEVQWIQGFGIQGLLSTLLLQNIHVDATKRITLSGVIDGSAQFFDQFIQSKQNKDLFVTQFSRTVAP